MKSSTSVLALGALASMLAFSAVPVAEAAPFPAPSVHFSMHSSSNDHRHDCRTDSQITRSLRAQGYHQIEEVGHGRHTLTFDASMGMRTYQLTVDSCSGQVLSKHRIHH
jgi:hypothetical protein